MRRSLLTDLAVVLGIALIGVVAWKLQPSAEVALPLSECNLNLQSCVIDIPGGGRMEIGFEPRPIPTLRPITVTVKLGRIDAERVEIDFAGVTMNMGFNRPLLVATGNGQFAGTATLPVCVTGAMEWQATALLHTSRGTVSVPFRFEAGRH